jgi:histidinol-phosphatase (PHP family)
MNDSTTDPKPLRGLADYHLHTPLCKHAEGTPSDYAAAAVALGLDEIGFSDHNPMARPFDDWRMAFDELGVYLEQVEAARGAFPELPIRLGLECDFIPGREAWIAELAGMARWDYLIGSVHYIEPGWDVDNPKWIGRFDERPVEEIWARYFAALERCVRSRLFDFIGHPDLVKKFGHRPGGDLARFYEPVIAAMAETGAVFEINTAGLRKAVGELYPADGFLKLAFAAGVPITINSDAHSPGEVGAGFSRAVAAARAAGYREVVRFSKRVRSVVVLP